jgi:2'-5' RNA ligase
VRLFVAAYPPARVRDDFADLVARLGVGQPRERGRSVRLAPVEQLHVTLAFLGEVPDPKIDAARLAVERAVKGVEPFALRISGGGTFGRGRFTVLWAGLREAEASIERPAGTGLERGREAAGRQRGHGTAGRQRGRGAGNDDGGDGTSVGRGRATGHEKGRGAALAGLAKAVRRELKAARLPYDPKPMRPHLTVARPGDRVTADELAADLAALAAYEGPEWTVDEIRLMRSHLGPRPTYDVMHAAPLAP